MISGINLAEVVDFTLSSDIENPTIWKIGVVPARVLAGLSGSKDQIDMAFNILQIGIKGWDNFGGIEFKTIKEKRFGVDLDVVPMELIEKIPLNAIAELAKKIVEVNKLSVPEIKN